MSTTRARRAATTAALTLVLSGAGAAAHADVYFDEAVHLSWDGRTYSGVTVESFLGTPVTVPGDSTSRTLLVRNDGPTAGLLRASIVDVELLDPDTPDTHHATGEDLGSFYDDLVVGWGTGSASLTDLGTDGVTAILEQELAKGEELAITLSYALPADATSGNRANVGPREASFDVLLEIGGDMPTDPPEESTAAPVVLPPQPPASGTSGTTDLPTTGAEVRVLAGLAALVAGLGAAVLVARRRTVAGRVPGP
ncbi:hypothetical protein FHE66_11935 [Georgenia sp. 311]|uniref:hypothetical protein n=1 Tax=Georgenia sp. 311 TaxID=2585134 RepID=UPI001112B8BB|nr:hypothetical protein [Georgenia sp. 311]TNC17144.1 hypothetical protein FHE66_11935 [Georgenia sp. 311]